MQSLLIADRPREEIGSVFNEGPLHGFVRCDRIEAIARPLQRGSVRIGYWAEQSGDPLPDVVIVRDEELVDTNAWLSAFLPGLAPISQWCRVMPMSVAERLFQRRTKGSHSFPLCAWVGASLAELSSQQVRNISLKDASGLAVTSLPTFAIARAAFIWRDDVPLAMAAQRYGDLQRRLGTPQRDYDSERLKPLWHALCGTDDDGSDETFRNALAPFRVLLHNNYSSSGVRSSELTILAREFSSFYNLPEIARCGTGTQAGRVDALDEVARKLMSSQSRLLLDALLGFAASLIDPGAAILPELLRRYNDVAPSASIWAGAFAGVWSPIRVLSDNNGIGRVVSKEIVKDIDLCGKPTSDINYEELVRWVGLGEESSTRVRGMSARVLNVELVPGVSIPVSYSHDQHRYDPRSNTASEKRQHAFDLNRIERSNSRGDRDRSEVASDQSSVTLSEVVLRLSALEKAFEERSAKTTRSSSRSPKKTS